MTMVWHVPMVATLAVLVALGVIGAGVAARVAAPSAGGTPAFRFPALRAGDIALTAGIVFLLVASALGAFVFRRRIAVALIVPAIAVAHLIRPSGTFAPSR